MKVLVVLLIIGCVVGHPVQNAEDTGDILKKVLDADPQDNNIGKKTAEVTEAQIVQEPIGMGAPIIESGKAKETDAEEINTDPQGKFEGQEITELDKPQPPNAQENAPAVQPQRENIDLVTEDAETETIAKKEAIEEKVQQVQKDQLTEIVKEPTAEEIIDIQPQIEAEIKNEAGPPISREAPIIAEQLEPAAAPENDRSPIKGIRFPVDREAAEEPTQEMTQNENSFPAQVIVEPFAMDIMDKEFLKTEPEIKPLEEVEDILGGESEDMVNEDIAIEAVGEPLRVDQGQHFPEIPDETPKVDTFVDEDGVEAFQITRDAVEAPVIPDAVSEPELPDETAVADPFTPSMDDIVLIMKPDFPLEEVQLDHPDQVPTMMAPIDMPIHSQPVESMITDNMRGAPMFGMVNDGSLINRDLMDRFPVRMDEDPPFDPLSTFHEGLVSVDHTMMDDDLLPFDEPIMPTNRFPTEELPFIRPVPVHEMDPSLEDMFKFDERPDSIFMQSEMEDRSPYFIPRGEFPSLPDRVDEEPDAMSGGEVTENLTPEGEAELQIEPFLKEGAEIIIVDGAQAPNPIDIDDQVDPDFTQMERFPAVKIPISQQNMETLSHGSGPKPSFIVVTPILKRIFGINKLDRNVGIVIIDASHFPLQTKTSPHDRPQMPQLTKETFINEMFNKAPTKESFNTFPFEDSPMNKDTHTGSHQPMIRVPSAHPSFVYYANQQQLHQHRPHQQHRPHHYQEREQPQTHYFASYDNRYEPSNHGSSQFDDYYYSPRRRFQNRYHYRKPFYGNRHTGNSRYAYHDKYFF